MSVCLSVVCLSVCLSIYLLSSVDADNCADHCGGKSPSGCQCDVMCTIFGDCCDDYENSGCGQCNHLLPCMVTDL